MMLFSIIRFWSKGWIEKLYVDPIFHFKYYGFEWVIEPGSNIYLLFIICGLSSLFLILGLYYRAAIIIFFLSFTYIELIDKTTYLNHYYFISILSLILCFVPANANFSLDNLRNKIRYRSIPRFYITSIQSLIVIVYFFAGIAKLNSDWLIDAQPLSIWISSKYDFPIFGNYIFQKKITHYLMSWGGMIYDLSIPFLLFSKRLRWFGFSLVILFHLFTAFLFPIGMFPYIMIISALIFFSAEFHENIIKNLRHLIRQFLPEISKMNQQIILKANYNRLKRPIFSIISLIIFLQIIFPMRYVFYPGELFWHEQGYRFSWRVMLMEKRGYTQFRIIDSVTKKQFYVNNDEFLTEFQEKQMSFQPDFIIEFAHHLGDLYKKKGVENIKVCTDSYVALNGRKSQQFVDPETNLLNFNESFSNKKWILPFNDEIKGF
jgi:hypothetical protein